jgi:hypothetical protein
VFRELLQNSDDASARAVEIRFETEAYLARSKQGAGGAGGVVEAAGAKEKLPDLKTVAVRGLF